MKLSFSAILAVIAAIICGSLTSCESGRSYAEMLNAENRAVNRYLVNQRVEGSIPPDTIFEVGENAPYYMIDKEAQVYMQVLRMGDGEKVKEDQTVYFRFMRYNLSYYTDEYGLPSGEGNQDNLAAENSYFRFENFQLPSSSQWGSGIQLPLYFLPLNSEVNLIVKSQVGWTSETSYVQPYLYHVRYYRSQI